jgi:hypothetical protein
MRSQVWSGIVADDPTKDGQDPSGSQGQDSGANSKSDAEKKTRDASNDASSGDNGKTDSGDNGKSDDPRDQEIAKLRRESANYRTQLRDVQGKLQEHENAKLSESERATKRIQGLEKERDETKSALRVAELKSAAAAAGAQDAEAVARLAPDDEGDAAEAVKFVREKYPVLFRPRGSADGGERSAGGSSQTGVSDAFRAAARASKQGRR